MPLPPQFLDIGIEGRLLWRRLPCHKCKGCNKADAQAVQKDCEFDHLCGKAKLVTISMDSSANIPLLRSAPGKLGVELCGKAQQGDFIGVEVLYTPDELDAMRCEHRVAVPWFLAEVVGPMREHKGRSYKCFMGKLPNDARALPGRPAARPTV